MPGPAFECNYDNKYKEGTAFSNDLGRVKQALNTNQHDNEILAGGEKAQF